MRRRPPSHEALPRPHPHFAECVRCSVLSVDGFASIMPFNGAEHRFLSRGSFVFPTFFDSLSLSAWHPTSYSETRSSGRSKSNAWKLANQSLWKEAVRKLAAHSHLEQIRRRRALPDGVGTTLIASREHTRAVFGIPRCAGMSGMKSAARTWGPSVAARGRASIGSGGVPTSGGGDLVGEVVVDLLWLLQRRSSRSGCTGGRDLGGQRAVGGMQLDRLATFAVAVASRGVAGNAGRGRGRAGVGDREVDGGRGHARRAEAGGARSGGHRNEALGSAEWVSVQSRDLRLTRSGRADAAWWAWARGMAADAGGPDSKGGSDSALHGVR